MDTSALAVTPKQLYSTDELRRIWRGKMSNIQNAWREFEQGALLPGTMPFKAIVELTQNCNFKCIMCPQSWEEKFKRYNPDFNMSMETFVKIADELFPTCTFVDLRGFGETTILPHWPEVVDYLERFPFIEWHLVTNLAMPRDDLWEKMMSLGFSLGFSCDGASAETVEGIRKGSRYDRLRHNLGVVRASIKKHNAGWIYFISTMQKRNVHEMRKIVELAHEFAVREVQFKVVQEGGHGEGIRDFDEGKMAQYANEAVDAALDLGVRVTFNDWLFTKNVDKAKVDRAAVWIRRHTPYPFPSRPSFDPTYWSDQGFETTMNHTWDSSRVSAHQKCFKPFSFTYVNYEAEMGTCNHMMYPDMLVMGDLKTQTLKEVWEGPKYLEFRRQLVTAQPLDPRCQWCFKHRLDD